MILPNVWGQGQFFVFSALDGDSFSKNDFVGTLLADKIGIRFYTKVKRELIFLKPNFVPHRFEAVTGDYLDIRFAGGDRIQAVYAHRHVIIGALTGKTGVMSFVEGRYTPLAENGVLIENTGDGEYTALHQADGQFVYAFGTSPDEVLAKIEQGRQTDLEKAIEKKKDFYRQHSLPDSHPYAKLAGKCLSTMKTQLYSPEGCFRGIWSTPDRLPHRHLWLWDSVFHAVGFRNIRPDLAEALILDVFDTQDENGFIPHYSTGEVQSDITQPPVIGWGAYKTYEKSGNRVFLQTVMKKNKAFLLWCRDHRRMTEKELYTWNTHSDQNCRCGESGMDNSPRFDITERLYAIDFSCFMANETRIMAKIAKELRDTKNEAFFTAWHQAIARDINEVLWCEEDGFYYDVVVSDGRYHKVSAVSSFLPLFSGVCDEKQAEALVKELKNPDTFGTELPIPSVSKKDPTFGSDMWRGPVWINYNYMITQGLLDYGLTPLAREIIQKTVDALNRWYQKNGTIYEYYDSADRHSPDTLNRKGEPLVPYDFTVRYQSVREYGWSNTLLLDWLYHIEL